MAHPRAEWAEWPEWNIIANILNPTPIFDKRKTPSPVFTFVPIDFRRTSFLSFFTFCEKQQIFTNCFHCQKSKCFCPFSSKSWYIGFCWSYGSSHLTKQNKKNTYLAIVYYVKSMSVSAWSGLAVWSYDSTAQPNEECSKMWFVA